MVKKTLALKGGAVADGQNAAQALAWPPDYQQFDFSNEVSIAAMAGAKNSAGGVASELDIATIVKDGSGNYRLAVDALETVVVLTPSAPAAVSVGVASGVLIAANAGRRYLALVNTSANYVSLAFGAAAVLYSGITLAPYGSYEMTVAAGNLYLGEIRAIASAAASNVGVQEGV